jgi:EpsI family protein
MRLIRAAACEYHRHRQVSPIGDFTRMHRNAIRVGAVLLAVAAVYWPDTAALGRYWLHKDANAQSGIIVALLCGFLLFRSRARFERLALDPVPWAGAPLIACAAASLICWRAGILTLQLFFLPPILWLAVLAVLGWQAARTVGFAIGFLYFALPGWDLLRPPLQHLTAGAVAVIGPMVGLPVRMAGMTASIAGGVAGGMAHRVTFTIEPGCSGADFLAVGLAIATLHGELEQAGPRRRAALIGGMTLLAILSNWLRVILIFAIGYLSDMRSPLATRGHAALGWVVFACALLVFVWAAGRSGAAGADTSAVLASDRDADARAITHPQRAVWRHGLVATALLIVPVLVYGSLIATEARAGTARFELPAARGLWRGPAAAADPLWRPEFVGPHAQRQAGYQRADGRAVEIVAIGFPQQRQGAQIFNDNNFLLGARGLAAEHIALARDGGIPHAEVVAIDANGRRWLIWSVIDVGGRLFGEPLLSQLWYGARSLAGAPYSALFALKTQCGVSCDGARAVLADFLSANGAALFAALPDSRLQG